MQLTAGSAISPLSLQCVELGETSKRAGGAAKAEMIPGFVSTSSTNLWMGRSPSLKSKFRRRQ